jgi:Polyketide cyclase / dehydrase and lipid transport
VFELICVPERLPEWNVSVERACRAVAGEPVGLGSRAIMSGRLLGQTLESETEVIEFDPPSRFSTRAIRGPKLTTRFELSAEGNLTRLQADVSGDVPGGAIGARLAEGFIRRELTASMERLRALCEQSIA